MVRYVLRAVSNKVPYMLYRCGSASFWSGFDFSPWCGSGFLFDADPNADLGYQNDADPQHWFIIILHRSELDADFWSIYLLVFFANLKCCLEKVAWQAGQGGESSGRGAHRLNPDTGVSSHFLREFSYGITNQIHLGGNKEWSLTDMRNMRWDEI